VDTLVLCVASCCLKKKKLRRKKGRIEEEGTSSLSTLSLIFLINFFTSAALAGAGQFQKLLITRK
jgi:hypothetical protein